MTNLLRDDEIRHVQQPLLHIAKEDSLPSEVAVWVDRCKLLLDRLQETRQDRLEDNEALNEEVATNGRLRAQVAKLREALRALLRRSP